MGSKRARYNSSMLDVNITNPGDNHELLPETYVIFITENDVLKKNLPIYHIERVILETGELFDDKSHIIYVNNEIKDNTPLGKLMQDFKHTKADDMNYNILADRVRYFKENDAGVSSMCKAMEEMRAEAAAKAAKEAAKAAAENAAETERTLRESGVSEDIIRLTVSRILKNHKDYTVNAG